MNPRTPTGQEPQSCAFDQAWLPPPPSFYYLFARLLIRVISAYEASIHTSFKTYGFADLIDDRYGSPEGAVLGDGFPILFGP